MWKYVPRVTHKEKIKVQLFYPKTISRDISFNIWYCTKGCWTQAMLYRSHFPVWKYKLLHRQTHSYYSNWALKTSFFFEAPQTSWSIKGEWISFCCFHLYRNAVYRIVSVLRWNYICNNFLKICVFSRNQTAWGWETNIYLFWYFWRIY